MLEEDAGICHAFMIAMGEEKDRYYGMAFG